MKIFLFFVLLFLVATNVLLAQKKTYRDSVKEFFADWHANNKSHWDTSPILEDAIVLDNDIDSLILLERSSSGYVVKFLEQGKKIYKFQYPSKDRIVVDSISLSFKERKYTLSKFLNPYIATWDSDIFPGNTFVRKKEVDSFFRRYYTAWKEMGDIQAKYDYEHEKYENDTDFQKLYLSHMDYRKHELWQNGYWKYSNPVFLKGCKVVVLYYFHYWGDNFISYFTILYKREKNHWVVFGDNDSGIIN